MLGLQSKVVTFPSWAKTNTGSAEFAPFELCGSSSGQAADFLKNESLPYPRTQNKFTFRGT
jgi:hypothetical protein